VEADEIDLSFEVGGPVVRLLAEEGDKVTRSDTLAMLEMDSFRHEVQRRAGQLDEAKARLEELESGFRQERIEQARARLERFQAEERYWKSEFQRIRRLHRKGVASQSKFESTRRQYQVSQANHREAREKLRELENGFRTEKIEQARSSVRSLEGALELARENLDDAVLKSPVNGWVLTDNVDAGEVVSPGTQVYTLADLKDVWIRAYVSEPDLGKIDRGDSVRIKTDSYPGKTYTGRISFISDRAEFTPRSVETQEERVKQVYRIKVTVDNPERQLKPGMPVDVIIPLDGVIQ
jgi:HlyD family secretion protein